MTSERIGTPEDRREGWPKECQESWAATFERWTGEGDAKKLQPIVVRAIAHTLKCNLDYIDELEELIARHRTQLRAAHYLILAATGPEDGPTSWPETAQRFKETLTEDGIK